MTAPAKPRTRAARRADPVPCPLTWPDHGPGVLDGEGPPSPDPAWRYLPLYRRPTLVEATTGDRIVHRKPVTLVWAFGEDGELVTYTFEMPQDELFRLLYGTGTGVRQVIA